MRLPTPPALTLRPAASRGLTDIGWLKSRHTFSFGAYNNPAHMGFRSLRVINDDHVDPGQGFGTHPHRDMEIFSYVLEGALEHRDSLGNGSILHPGTIQVMSAGKGITHSERNPSSTAPTHFLQVWITPHTRGLPPRYTEWTPPAASDAPKVLMISPDGQAHSAIIHQDALVYRLRLKAGEQTEHQLGSGRGLWVQMAHGRMRIQDQTLSPGDGASSESTGDYRMQAIEDTEALLFDLG